MEENEIVKHDGGIIKHVSNAIMISNLLLKEFEITKMDNKKMSKKEFIERLNKLPEDQQSKIRKRLAAMRIIQDYLDKKGEKEK